ncbi:MAG: hypothetical protein ACO3AV_02445 [Ilumatobacteraceae bacterium]|jgi:hypothetical protein
MSATQPDGHLLVRVNVVGTAVFVVAEAVAIPLRSERPAQVLVAVVSLLLFAMGVATALWAYTSALERSRVHEVGVANLFLLTGPTAPATVRRTMTAALVVQVVLGLGGAIVGSIGLGATSLNALAFGVLVPMLGIGMNGAWAARYGSFGPRLERTREPRSSTSDSRNE